MRLPTKQEYMQRSPQASVMYNKYSEPKYKCEHYEGSMRKRLDIILTSLPPKFQYECDTCNNVEYLDF